VTNNTKTQKSLKNASVIIKYRARHFERGRSRQPIRVKLWRHGMCARTITDSRRLRSMHAHGEYNLRVN